MDFVIIANSWNAAVDNPTSKHHVAMELARQGHRVLWVEGVGMRRPSLGSSSDRGRMVEKVRRALRGSEEVSRNIWRTAPLVIPIPSSAAVRAVNDRIYLLAISSAARKAGFVEPVLINFMPNLPGVVKKWKWASIYYCVDRWDAFGIYDSALIAGLNEQCCRNADMVIASSKDLYERCLKSNPDTHLVTHGVDYKHFSSGYRLQVTGFRCSDLPSGNSIIGFVGLISEWVDQDLLVKLARENREINIVLIGKADVSIERLRGEPNIHIMGPRPFAELPAYISAFNVGIIPFAVNDLTRAVNPIKLQEMLAAGCPVVSTDLPEVRSRAVGGRLSTVDCPYPASSIQSRLSKRSGVSSNGQPGTNNRQLTTDLLPSGFTGVAVAGNSDEFVRLVKERLEKPFTLEQKRAVSESVKAETWEAKVREILELIGRKG